MRIFFDGQRVPVNIRVSRDLLLTLKSLARIQHWRTTYDPAKEIVFIYSRSPSLSESTAPDSEFTLQEITEMESSRLTGKVICLDPGHGGGDPGAIGPSGVTEKDNNLAIALQLKSLLESNGATVVMTRDSDQEAAQPASSAKDELDARINIANDADADILISIHNDSFTSARIAGTATFHYGDKESLELASAIQTALVGELGTQDRGVRFASFYLIRYSKMPAVTVEVAFISCPEEELLLASAEGRQKAAAGIFRGIVKYFKV